MSQTTSSSGAHKRPYRKYYTAFRKTVVEQMQHGRPVGEIAEAYGVRVALLYRRRSRYGQSSPGGSYPGKPIAIRESDDRRICC